MSLFKSLLSSRIKVLGLLTCWQPGRAPGLICWLREKRKVNEASENKIGHQLSFESEKSVKLKLPFIRHKISYMWVRSTVHNYFSPYLHIYMYIECPCLYDLTCIANFDHMTPPYLPIEGAVSKTSSLPPLFSFALPKSCFLIQKDSDFR